MKLFSRKRSDSNSSMGSFASNQPSTIPPTPGSMSVDSKKSKRSFRPKFFSRPQTSESKEGKRRNRSLSQASDASFASNVSSIAKSAFDIPKKIFGFRKKKGDEMPPHNDDDHYNGSAFDPDGSIGSFHGVDSGEHFEESKYRQDGAANSRADGNDKQRRSGGFEDEYDDLHDEISEEGYDGNNLEQEGSENDDGYDMEEDGSEREDEYDPEDDEWLAMKDELHTRLLAFYHVHKPDRVDHIESIEDKYYGREELLIRKLEKQYQVQVPTYQESVEILQEMGLYYSDQESVNSDSKLHNQGDNGSFQDLENVDEQYSSDQQGTSSEYEQFNQNHPAEDELQNTELTETGEELYNKSGTSNGRYNQPEGRDDRPDFSDRLPSPDGVLENGSNKFSDSEISQVWTTELGDEAIPGKEEDFVTMENYGNNTQNKTSPIKGQFERDIDVQTESQLIAKTIWIRNDSSSPSLGIECQDQKSGDEKYIVVFLKADEITNTDLDSMTSSTIELLKQYRCEVAFDILKPILSSFTEESSDGHEKAAQVSVKSENKLKVEATRANSNFDVESTRSDGTAFSSAAAKQFDVSITGELSDSNMQRSEGANESNPGKPSSSSRVQEVDEMVDGGGGRDHVKGNVEAKLLKLEKQENKSRKRLSEENGDFLWAGREGEKEGSVEESSDGLSQGTVHLESDNEFRNQGKEKMMEASSTEPFPLDSSQASSNSTSELRDEANGPKGPAREQNPFGDSSDTANPIGNSPDETNSFGDSLDAANPIGNLPDETNPFGDSLDAANTIGDSLDGTNPIGDSLDAAKPIRDSLEVTNPIGDSQPSNKNKRRKSLKSGRLFEERGPFETKPEWEKRKHALYCAIREFIESEHDYAMDLSLLSETVAKTFAAQRLGSIGLPKDQHQLLKDFFATWTKLAPLHRKFQSQLRRTCFAPQQRLTQRSRRHSISPSSEIVVLLESSLDSLHSITRSHLLPELEELYLAYCARYAQVMELYARELTRNATFAKAVSGCLDEMVNASPLYHKGGTRLVGLESFFIRPVQRLCKYPLLVDAIAKHLQGLGEPDPRDKMQELKEAIESCVESVNANQGDVERVAALAEINGRLRWGVEKKDEGSLSFLEPFRRLERLVSAHVLVRHVESDVFHPRLLVVFNDVLLITVARKSWRNPTVKVYDVFSVVPLRGTSLSSVTMDPKELAAGGIEGYETLSLEAGTEPQMRAWTIAVRNLEECEELFELLDRLSSESSLSKKPLSNVILDLQKVNYSARKYESAFARQMARARLSLWSGARNLAETGATMIQKTFRGMLGRKNAQEHRQALLLDARSAVIIQCAYRRMIRRRQLRQLRQQELERRKGQAEGDTRSVGERDDIVSSGFRNALQDIHEQPLDPPDFRAIDSGLLIVSDLGVETSGESSREALQGFQEFSPRHFDEKREESQEPVDSEFSSDDGFGEYEERKSAVHDANTPAAADPYEDYFADMYENEGEEDV